MRLICVLCAPSAFGRGCILCDGFPFVLDAPRWGCLVLRMPPRRGCPGCGGLYDRRGPCIKIRPSLPRMPSFVRWARLVYEKPSLAAPDASVCTIVPCFSCLWSSPKPQFPVHGHGLSYIRPFSGHRNPFCATRVRCGCGACATGARCGCGACATRTRPGHDRGATRARQGRRPFE